MRNFKTNEMRVEQVASIMPMSVAEYIEYELKAVRRHEYVNGQLFEMPGEKDINNQVAGFFYIFFFTHLASRGYQIFVNDIKVAVPGGHKYYYPDVFATKELRSEQNSYIKYEPEIIVEVLSPSTYITDTVDKYLAYTTIPSLKYYLTVEPESVYVTLYAKNEEGKWEAMPYVKKADAIPLPLLELSLPLAEIYKTPI